MDYLHTDSVNTKRSSLSDPLVLLLWEFCGDSHTFWCLPSSSFSHLSGHYGSKVVHGWCPPPVQFQSGILGLDSDVTGEVLNKALRKADAVLGSSPPPLITVSSADGSCL